MRIYVTPNRAAWPHWCAAWQVRSSDPAENDQLCSAACRAQTSKCSRVTAFFGSSTALGYLLGVQLQVTGNSAQKQPVPVTVKLLPKAQPNLCCNKVLLCCIDTEEAFYAVSGSGTPDNICNSCDWCTACRPNDACATAPGCSADDGHTNHCTGH